MLKPRKKITRKQIKEDPLVTYYFKVVEFLRVHSQKIMIGVIALLAILVLTVLFARSKKSADSRAAEQLSRATVELSQRRTQQGIDILLALVDNFSGTKSATRGEYYLATAYYEQGEYEKAQLYFEEFIDDNDGDQILLSAAYSGLGATLEQQKKFLDAAQAYEDGAKKYEDSYSAAQQLMDAARCYLAARQIPQAKKCYQKIVDEYAESSQKADAELYLARIKS